MKNMRRLIRKIILFPLSVFIIKDYLQFKRKGGGKRFSLRARNFFPCVWDKTRETHFDRHYVFHTAWAARCVQAIRPEKHIDVGSSLYFSAIVSAFIPVDFYDYRPARLDLSGLESKEGDLMQLPFSDNSIESLSCLHTVEHVGLGRYGEPIDPEGDLKAMRELARITRPGGSLLIVVPTGAQSKIEFNAHRIYSYDALVGVFKDFDLKNFSYIPEHAERGGLIEKARREDISSDSYGCGCYWFVKK